MKIKKNDLVLVIKGKDRKRTGKVIKALPKENKVVIEGLNLVKKHIRPRRQGEKGKIVEVPRPIYVSNVKLICPKCGDATKVGYNIVDNKKKRFCKKCKKIID
ncbi:MAG: 50S ribosomal protein L24 [Candidatus Parcubacteria bacterium]|nr:MAG: 50S ribosomal protein L24 [Candidatus Parcubacteria bacterium]